MLLFPVLVKKTIVLHLSILRSLYHWLLDKLPLLELIEIIQKWIGTHRQLQIILGRSQKQQCRLQRALGPQLVLKRAPLIEATMVGTVFLRRDSGHNRPRFSKLVGNKGMERYTWQKLHLTRTHRGRGDASGGRGIGSGGRDPWRNMLPR